MPNKIDQLKLSFLTLATRCSDHCYALVIKFEEKNMFKMLLCLLFLSSNYVIAAPEIKDFLDSPFRNVGHSELGTFNQVGLSYLMASTYDIDHKFGDCGTVVQKIINTFLGTEFPQDLLFNDRAIMCIPATPKNFLLVNLWVEPLSNTKESKIAMEEYIKKFNNFELLETVFNFSLVKGLFVDRSLDFELRKESGKILHTEKSKFYVDSFQSFMKETERQRTHLIKEWDEAWGFAQSYIPPFNLEYINSEILPKTDGLSFNNKPWIILHDNSIIESPLSIGSFHYCDGLCSP